MTHRGLLLVVVFGAILSLELARETDMDFWWHVRTGDLIAQSAAVPVTDPFSFTARGRRWIVLEWLWDVVIAGLCRRGGYALAVGVSSLVVALTYAVLYRLLRRLGANEFVAALLTLWSAALALP